MAYHTQSAPPGIGRPGARASACTHVHAGPAVSTEGPTAGLPDWSGPSSSMAFRCRGCVGESRLFRRGSGLACIDGRELLEITLVRPTLGQTTIVCLKYSVRGFMW